MTPDDHALLHAWAGLARRSYARHPEYRGDDAALARHRQSIVEAICRGRIEGAVRAYWAGDRLRAALASWPEPDSWFGATRRPILINRDPDDAEAADWIVAQVAELGVDDRTDICLLASDRRLVDPLMAACPRLGIDAVILLGDPKAALAALVEARDPPPVEDAGLTMSPIQTAAEADTLVELTRQVFAAHPGWCWFGTRPRSLARERAGMLTSIGGGDPDDLTEAIRDGGRVVGMVQLHLDDNPLWGRCAGVGLLLHPDWWGRGLLKSLYRRALTRLVAADVALFKGGTSQPPVMRLARMMKRPLHAIQLRSDPDFPRDHFTPYLPLADRSR